MPSPPVASVKERAGCSPLKVQAVRINENARTKVSITIGDSRGVRTVSLGRMAALYRDRARVVTGPPPSRQLTAGSPIAIMKAALVMREHNPSPSQQVLYDRIRPQGGRCFRTLPSFHREYRGDDRKRNVGTNRLPERRGSAVSANPFLESPAHGRGEALQVRGVSGSTTQEPLRSRISSCSSPNRRRPLLADLPLKCVLFLLLLATALLAGCGHKKPQAQL